MTRRLMLALAALALLAGCSDKPSDNTDPRKGRVYTTYSDCGLGSCVIDWKACVGPDLIIHLDSAQPADHTIKDSPECTS